MNFRIRVCCSVLEGYDIRVSDRVEVR